MTKIRVLRDEDMPEVYAGQEWAKETVKEVQEIDGLFALKPGDIIDNVEVDTHFGTATFNRTNVRGEDHPWYLPAGWFEVVA